MCDELPITWSINLHRNFDVELQKDMADGFNQLAEVTKRMLVEAMELETTHGRRQMVISINFLTLISAIL